MNAYHKYRYTFGSIAVVIHMRRRVWTRRAGLYTWGLGFRQCAGSKLSLNQFSMCCAKFWSWGRPQATRSYSHDEAYPITWVRCLDCITTSAKFLWCCSPGPCPASFLQGQGPNFWNTMKQWFILWEIQVHDWVRQESWWAHTPGNFKDIH